MEPELLTSFDDLLTLFRQHRKPILYCTLFFALAAATYTLTRPVIYTAEATFREKSSADSGVTDSALKILSLGEESSNSEAVSWFRSRTLMEKLIEKNGLQAEIAAKQSLLSRSSDHLVADYARYKKSKTPSLKKPPKPLSVEHVVYKGDAPLLLKVIPEKDGSYSLYEGKKRRIGQGVFGEPFVCEQFHLTLNKSASQLKKPVPLTLWPLSTLAEMMIETVTAKLDNKDKTLVRLQFAAKDRLNASAQLNQLMALYQQQLSNQHQRIIDEQIHYLEKRQEEMTGTLNHLLEQHVLNLSSDLSKSGFANSEKAMEFLATTLQKHKKNLFSIELEMKRLKTLGEGEIAFPDNYKTEDDPVTINALLSEIRTLKQQGDAIELALQQVHPKPTPTQEFQGINLKTAQELYMSFCKEKSELESKSKQYTYLLDQIQDPHFEMTSLSTVLVDPVSRGMIERASELTLALKDENHRSTKEQMRIKEELALQRDFLHNHLRQTLTLSQLQEKQVLEKVHTLQQITLALIQEQIALLQKHLHAYIATHLTNLDQEKRLITQHQQELSRDMARVPSQWISEKMIDRHLNMNERLMGEVTKLVETKNIASNLEVIQAGPIDLAVPPLHPQSRHLLLFTLFGAFFGASLSCSFLFGRTAFQGVAATEENLQLANCHVSGSLPEHLHSPLRDEELEVCRHVLSFFGEAKTLLLIRGEGPDISHALAELLAKRGAKTLLMPLTFDDPTTPGLLQYLEGTLQTLPIVNDTVPSGGMSRFCPELTSSPRFANLLEELKTQYDHILAITSARPLSAEAESLLSHFEKAVVISVDEKLHKLQPYRNKNITFVLRK